MREEYEQKLMEKEWNNDEEGDEYINRVIRRDDETMYVSFADCFEINKDSHFTRIHKPQRCSDTKHLVRNVPCR